MIIIALTQGNQALADDINALKARVKAEMQRRQYNGSLTDYASSNYDYTTIPAVGVTAKVEHINKIITPMNAITSQNQTVKTSGSPLQAISELNTNLTAYEAETATYNGTSSCNSSCSGLCVSECSNSCTGCSGTCTGTCTGGCTSCSGCSGSCSGCSGSCSGCSGCGYDCQYWAFY